MATPAIERRILTLYTDGHASHRGIQVCLRALSGQNTSLDTIGKVVHEAERRALKWFDTAVPPTSRALAPDEMYGNDRRGAYLSVVDVHAHVVWSVNGPLPVDTDTWTLVFWELQDRKLHWHTMTEVELWIPLASESIRVCSMVEMSGTCCTCGVRSRGV